MSNKKDIKDILKEQREEDQGYAITAYYEDLKEIDNYNQHPGAYFYHDGHVKALIKITKDALLHGLAEDQKNEYIEGSSVWPTLNDKEKNKVLQEFSPLSDFISIISDAYEDNTPVPISDLPSLYQRILNSDLKPDIKDDLRKKFDKIVDLSITKGFHGTRLSYPGEKSSRIVHDAIYIRPNSFKLFSTSSSNVEIRILLNQIYISISSRAKDEHIRQIMDLSEIINFQDANRFIKFKNDYVFDIETQEIIPYTETMFIIKKFDFNYNPDAKCDRWVKFLGSSVDENDIPVLQEFFGYIFYYGLPAQNFLILKGPTRSGKGTTLRVLISLIGNGNISAVPASALFSKDDQGHNLASLEGKMVNVDGETPPNDLNHISNLKKFTGMDLIWANEKYQIPHAFIYTGKLVFALNSLPKIKLNDQEIDSFFSRILIINYTKSHTEDQNTHLADELIEELPGIFNWAMDGLKRLKSNDFKFSNIQNLEEKQRLYTLESDPLKVFSDEWIVPGNEEYTPESLFTEFNSFCSQNFIDPSMNVKSLRSFQLKISDILKAREDLKFEKIRSGHSNSTAYTGISIKTPDLPKTETTDKKETNLEKSEHAPMIMDYRYGNKDTETLYYRLNKDFNKFDGAFFYGSSIIVDSVRKIMVPRTSEIAYVLYKLRIPKHSTDSDYPRGWLRFTTSAEPLDEKAYNALSRGDEQ
jgi:putative DNA primase/helicase